MLVPQLPAPSKTSTVNVQPMTVAPVDPHVVETSVSAWMAQRNCTDDVVSLQEDAAVMAKRVMEAPAASLDCAVVLTVTSSTPGNA